MVALECAAKEALGVEGIVDRVKARSRAETILELARRDGDNRPPSEITIGMRMLRAGKVQETQVSVQQLLEQASGLDAHRAGCLRCPLNKDSAAGYGCYDSISYPIEAATERWLLSCLPESLETPAGYLFQSPIPDIAWDGAQATEMRGQGDTFFELRTAPVRRWSPAFAVSGDQLFHMMFHVGHIGSSHAMMVGMFFGFVTLGDAAPEPPPVPASANAQQMARFLSTLGQAASEKLDVLIDG